MAKIILFFQTGWNFHYRKSKSLLKDISIKEDEDFKKLGKEILINHFKNQGMRYSETNVKNILDKFKLKELDNLYKFMDVEDFT